jgi:hypothetical protein
VTPHHEVIEQVAARHSLFTASYAHDDDGNLTSAWAAADMNCDGYVTSADIAPFVVALNQGQAAYETAYPDCEYLNADINGDGYVTAADYSAFVGLVTGGNAAVAMTYTYNGENRLIAAEPTEPQSGNLRVSFVYDYLGRRVLKVVEEYDGASWSETARRKFVWSGWLMLVEIDCGTGVPSVNDVCGASTRAVSPSPYHLSLFT